MNSRNPYFDVVAHFGPHVPSVSVSYPLPPPFCALFAMSDLSQVFHYKIRSAAKITQLNYFTSHSFYTYIPHSVSCGRRTNI